MSDEGDSLFYEAVSVRSLEDLRRLPAQTRSVILDVLDDERAEALSRRPALRAILHSGDCRITDRGLQALAKLGDLEILDLEWSDHITDRGLDCLTALSRLRFLDIGFSARLSDEAIARVKRALPHCEVVSCGAGSGRP